MPMALLEIRFGRRTREAAGEAATSKRSHPVWTVREAGTQGSGGRSQGRKEG